MPYPYRTRTARPPKIFKPKVIWSPDMLKWAVITPFTTELYTGEEFREELKLLCEIPPSFDRDIKAWLVEERDEQCVRELLKKYWPTYSVEWGDKPKGGFGRNYDPSADDSPFRKLFILAGPDAGNKLWKAAMLIHHTDVGGSNGKAQEANVAWTEIKRQLNW